MPKRTKDGSAIRVALVASEFNYDVTLLMLERAKEEVEFLGATLGPVMKTPGVWDMPLAASYCSAGTMSTRSSRSAR